MQTKDILKELRKTKGYSNAKDFCEDFGISFNTYQNYETGKRTPTADVLIKLADFYGVTTDYLLGREPAPEPSIDFGVVAEEWDVLQKRMDNLPETEKAVLLNILHMLSEANKNQQDKAYHEVTAGELQDAAVAEDEAKKDAG